MQTTTNNLKVRWLADTGSPRSFITAEQATEIMKHNPAVKLQQYSSPTKYKCFNNNNIKIDGEINITLQSGSWTAKNCRILVVGHKTNNLMGRDVLQKLGITLQQKPNNSPDQATLQHPALPREIMWDWDHDSEPELDIQYKTRSQPLPANSDTDDSENAPLLSHKRVHEEKTALAKQQELIAKQQRKAPLQQTATQQNQPGPSRSAIDTQPMGHAEIVAMAKKNQQAQKRQRATKKATSKPPQKQQRQQAPRNKSPWNPQRPQWLKNAKTRLTKPSLASTFELKSKAAALQQSREAKSKPERKLLYSSSSESKSFISVNKNKLKFSPTVKIHNIQSESPGKKHFEIITSSDPQDFMMESNEPTNQQQTSSSFSPPSRKLPQGIMKSTPKWDKLVEKIWSQPNHESTGLEMSSTEDFPIQPPIKKVEVVYLDSTTSEIANTADTTIITISEVNSENILDEQAPVNDHPNDHQVQDTNDTNDVAITTPANDEEHKSPSTSPAKSSISSLHTSDFFNPEEF